MPYEHDNELVDATPQACGDYQLPEIFAALVVTGAEPRAVKFVRCAV